MMKKRKKMTKLFKEGSARKGPDKKKSFRSVGRRGTSVVPLGPPLDDQASLPKAGRSAASEVPSAFCALVDKDQWPVHDGPKGIAALRWTRRSETTLLYPLQPSGLLRQWYAGRLPCGTLDLQEFSFRERGTGRVISQKASPAVQRPVPSAERFLSMTWAHSEPRGSG